MLKVEWTCRSTWDHALERSGSFQAMITLVVDVMRSEMFKGGCSEHYQEKRSSNGPCWNWLKRLYCSGNVDRNVRLFPLDHDPVRLCCKAGDSFLSLDVWMLTTSTLLLTGILGPCPWRSFTCTFLLSLFNLVSASFMAWSRVRMIGSVLSLDAWMPITSMLLLTEQKYWVLAGHLLHAHFQFMLSLFNQVTGCSFFPSLKLGRMNADNHYALFDRNHGSLQVICMHIFNLCCRCSFNQITGYRFFPSLKLERMNANNHYALFDRNLESLQVICVHIFNLCCRCSFNQVTGYSFFPGLAASPNERFEAWHCLHFVILFKQLPPVTVKDSVADERLFLAIVAVLWADSFSGAWLELWRQDSIWIQTRFRCSEKHFETPKVK
jgi:hypothetical protein